MSDQTAGESTCPVCLLTWTVTMWQDCFLPSCGCYGDDPSDANPSRPCEPCGMRHTRTCDKMPGRDDPRTLAALDRLVEDGIATRLEDGRTIIRTGDA